jgi:putative transposase
MRKSRQQQLADTGIFHKFFKGHNGENILATDKEKEIYLKCLCETKKNPDIKDKVLFHNYCLMSNHPHEVGSVKTNMNVKNSRAQSITALGNWMRNAHSRFGKWYNKKHNRYGKVSNERPKTTQLKSDFDTINTMLYTEANPVRAKMVIHPSKYKWSSYSFYAFGEKNEYTNFLDIPKAYLALGKTPGARQRAYRSLMDRYLRRNGLLNDEPSDEIIDLSMHESTYHCILELISRAQRAGP